MDMTLVILFTLSIAGHSMTIQFTPPILHQVLDAAEWQDMILLCDIMITECPAHAEDIVSTQPAVYVTMDLTNRSLIAQMFEKYATPCQLNWLVYCDPCEILLNEINVFEDTHDLQGYFMFKYQWIFVIDYRLSFSANSNPALQENSTTTFKEYSTSSLEESSTFDFITNSAPVSEENAISIFQTSVSFIFEESFNYSFKTSQCKIMNLLFIGPRQKLSTAMFGVDGSHYLQEIKQNQPWDKTELFPNTLTGLNNITLTFTVLPSHTYITKDKSGSYTRYFIKLINMIAEKLKFTYHIIEPDDGKYGSLENQTWTGM